MTTLTKSDRYEQALDHDAVVYWKNIETFSRVKAHGQRHELHIIAFDGKGELYAARFTIDIRCLNEYHQPQSGSAMLFTVH